MLKISSPRASFSSSTKPIRPRNLRSVSFPARSSSNVHKLELELDKLSSPRPESSPLQHGITSTLSTLSEVYKRIGDLLSCQPAGAHQTLHQGRWAQDTCDDLIRYLDVCGSTRDALLHMQETVQELMSSLRRSNCRSSTIESGISGFLSSRKIAKKEAAKSLASLKHAAGMNCNNNKLAAGARTFDLYAAATAGAVREASFHTVSVFDELLSCLSAKSSKAGRRWSVVAKLVHIKGCEFDQGKKKMNELESVEVALNELCSSIKDSEADSGDYMRAVELAQRKLEVLDRSIGGVEKELECLFRRLIQARVSLLNLLSH